MLIQLDLGDKSPVFQDMDVPRRVIADPELKYIATAPDTPHVFITDTMYGISCQ